MHVKGKLLYRKIRINEKELMVFMLINQNYTKYLETFLVVQWTRLLGSNAGGSGSFPGQGTKIPHGVLCSQKKRERMNENYTKYLKQTHQASYMQFGTSMSWPLL